MNRTTKLTGFVALSGALALAVSGCASGNGNGDSDVTGVKRLATLFRDLELPLTSS